MPEYEAQQRTDRRAGFASGVFVVICWLISNQMPAFALSLGVVIALAGLIYGMLSQEHVARRVVHDLRLGGRP